MVLLRSKEKCSQCMSCETLLPGFIATYNGRLHISEESLKRDDVQQAAQNVIDMCLEGAISLCPGDADVGTFIF